MRTAALLAVLVVSVFLCFAQQPATPASSANPAAQAGQRGSQSATPHETRPEPSPDKPAEAVYQNIKSLKGIPSTEVIPSMQFFAGALGVGCEHCHVLEPSHRDFASDQKKPKQIARQMIAMMKQIDETSFKGEQEVTCGTCHNGHPNPSRTAPLATAESLKTRAHPEPPVDRASLPQAEQLFEAFTNAIGGQAAIDKLKSSRGSGQVDMGRGGPMAFESMQQAPNKTFTKIEVAPSREHVEAFDGTSGWTKDGPRVNEAKGNELSVMKIDSSFYLEIDPKRVFPNAQTRGKDKVGDKDAWVVRASFGKDQPQQLLYFDPDSKLLVRRVLLVPTPFGPLNTQIDYSDWREVNGVKVPFTETQTRPNAIITERFTNLQFNVPVDEKVFAKPASQATATGTGSGSTR
jgi:hypothetical protein